MFYEIRDGGFIGNGCSEQIGAYTFDHAGPHDLGFVKPKVVDGVVVEGATSEETTSNLAAYKTRAVKSIYRKQGKYRGDKLGHLDDDPWMASEHTLKTLDAHGQLNTPTAPQLTGVSKKLLPAQISVTGPTLGETEASEAAVVVTKSLYAAEILGKTAGFRKTRKAAIEAATTKAAVDAEIAAYDAEMVAYLASV